MDEIIKKIKQKLIELGYERTKIDCHKGEPVWETYIKHCKYCYIEVHIYLKPLKNIHFVSFVVYDIEEFAYPSVLKHFQQAFDTRNKDLEELQQCQN